MTRRGTENKRKTAVAMVYCCVFMFSFSVSSSVYNTLAPLIIRHYGIDLITSSWISVTANAGNLLINMLIVRYGDRFGKAKTLSVLTIALGILLMILGAAPALGIYLAVNCLTGMVSWWIDNLTTSYVSDMYGDDRGRYIGILYTLFAVGSSVAPGFNLFVQNRLHGQWNTSYLCLGIFMSIAAVSYAVLTAAVGKPATYSEQTAAEERKLSIKSMLRNRNMVALILSGVTMAFYSYFSYTLATYFEWTDPAVYDRTRIGIIASCSAVGAMISRFAYIPLAKKLDPIRYLRFQSLFCTCCSLICLLVDRPAVWMVLELINGLVYGSSYTMTIVLTCGEYPDCSSSANAATGLASGIAYLLASPAINFVAQKIGFFTAMLIPVMFGFATYFIYRFMYSESREREE